MSGLRGDGDDGDGLREVRRGFGGAFRKQEERLSDLRNGNAGRGGVRGVHSASASVFGDGGGDGVRGAVGHAGAEV